MGVFGETQGMHAGFALLSAFALACACAMLAWALPGEAAAEEPAGAFESGVYEVGGTLLQAAQDSESMADGAFEKPMALTVKGESAVLGVRLAEVGGQHLGSVSYFESYGANEAPTAEEARAATVKAENADGTPAEVQFPVDLSLESQWLKLTIPFMEQLAPGSGTQYVRLVLDYGSMKRIADAPAADPSDATQEAPAEDAAQAADARYYRQLAEAIGTADSYLKRASEYTDASVSQLRKRRAAAQALLEEREADALAVVMQIGDLRWGMLLLEPAGAQPLDFSDLPDGTYTVAGSMVKVDKQTASMADAAIGHDLTLAVKGGDYRLVIGLGSVSVGSKTGYLGSMRYYKAGYSTQSNGALAGSTAGAKVLSYQMRDGKRVADEYGTDYPASVQMPVIPEAKADGYVPVSIYVPIMDSISRGTGTQSAYLKLDTSSVVSGDAPATPAAGSATTQAEHPDAQPAGGTGLSSSAALAGSASGVAGTAPGSLPASETSGKKAAQAEGGVAGARPAGDGGDDSARVSQVVPVEKQPPLKGSVAPLAAGLAAVACVIAGAVAFRKRGRLS